MQLEGERVEGVIGHGCQIVVVTIGDPTLVAGIVTAAQSDKCFLTLSVSQGRNMCFFASGTQKEYSLEKVIE